MMATGYVKYNAPRQLSQKESLQNLNHWRDAFISYYKRDKAAAHFLKPGVTWDPKHQTYDIKPQETGETKRNAEELHQDLLLFLSNLAGFLPWDYVSVQIKEESTCMQDCWDYIYDLMEAKVGTDTFLDYSRIKREPGETYRCLYERMCGHVRQHLPKAGLTIKGISTETGEKMTIALYNLIASNWLDLINPHLKDIVRKEFANQFADKKHLCELVSVIAPQIDGMLQRHDIKSVTISKVASEPAAPVNQILGDEDGFEEDVENQIRWIKKYRKDNRRSGGNQGGGSGQNGGSRPFCPSCNLLKKTVKSDKTKSIDVYHDPKNCRRRHFAVKLVEELEKELSEDSEEGEKHSLPEKSDSETSILQIRLEDKIEKPPESSQCVEKVRKPPDFNREDISELDEEEHRQLLLEVRRVISQNNVAKAKSPSLFGSILGKGTEITFDEGAQINVLDDRFARDLGLKIKASRYAAKAANQTLMQVTGQTEEDLVVKFECMAGTVENNLGKVITVSDLGVPLLIGEPGKRDNNVVTIPAEKRIEFRNGVNIISMPYYRNKRGKADYKVARVQCSTTLFPDEAINIKLDEEMVDKKLSVTPRAGASWLKPIFCDVSGDCMKLYNSSSMPVSLKKGDHVADIRTCCVSEGIPQIKKVYDVKRVYDKVEDEFMYQDFSKIKDDFDENIKQVDIDPDKILSEDERRMFWEVTEHYKTVFTPRPGKYNGYYGPISNRLNFASTPVQNTRVYTPNYSPEMKKILAEKLDKLIDWGVLVRPEDHNIQVERISASLIVPKHEPGEYRVVTDFTGLNTHLKKIPSVSPTIAEAKQSMAKSKYIVMMDLSNYFYQGGTVAEDSQYLGTMHPFKGVLIYSCMAQGVKGASETSYERIERIFGDMVQDGRLATMADGIYPKGNTVLECLENYAEVLRRAKLCGLTFKPSKTIICPMKAELFGWELDNGKWKPTVHTKSTLASYEQPKTVKQLRSYLGAWKQMSSCINNYAVLLHPLEQLIAGKASKEWLVWTEETKEAFRKSREAAGEVDGVYEARPDDIIHTYSDFSQANRAVGGRMMLHRKDEKTGEMKILLGGHFSSTLDKHKRNWLACEGEAAGIRLTLMHFAPQIRSSRHDAIHHTDSKPCVQAWGRSKKGAYSASSRIATFLTDLSSLSVDLVYTPGKEMYTSDFASRHPPDCKNIRCQVCKFVQDWEILGDNAGNIRSVSVEDIQQGRSAMPFTQRRVLHDIQHNDAMHNKLRDLITLGHLPDKRKTGGENTKLKLLHNLYKDGKLKVDRDGVIVIKSESGYYGGHVISLPQNIFRGFANALHVRLDHPSKQQLTSLLKRYFYTVGMSDIIAEINSSCQQCISLKVLPKVLSESTTSQPERLGSDFAADVIEMNAQNIFVIRESLSQFTQALIIPDQRAATMEEAIIRTTLELMPDSGTTVRVDGAKAFQSLEINSREGDTYLSKYNITLDIGRRLNRNKNPQAENAIKEVEKEILRIWPNGKFLNNLDLAMVMKNVNSRIRYNGLAPREILLRRDLLTNEEKNVKDKLVVEVQSENRSTNNTHQERFLGKLRKKTPAQSFPVGTLVFVRSELSKLKARELYIVEERLDKDPVAYIIRKAGGKLRKTVYEAREDELIAAPQSEQTQTETEHETEEELESGHPTKEGQDRDGEEMTRNLPGTPTPSPSTSRGSSSNDYLINYRNNPRRQAAIKAHHRATWNRAITIENNPAIFLHGFLEDDDEDFNFIYETEQYPVPGMENMHPGHDNIVEDNAIMDVDDSRDNSRDINMQVNTSPEVTLTVRTSEPLRENTNKNQSSSDNPSKFGTVNEARSSDITEIIPTRIFERRSELVEFQPMKARVNNQRTGSPSLSRDGRRIDPFKVGDWGDLLDRANERLNLETRPSRSTTKKPEGHYRHLHNKGRDQH